LIDIAKKGGKESNFFLFFAIVGARDSGEW